MKVKVEDILIEFLCTKCNLVVDVPLTEIFEVGTPLCTICEDYPEMSYEDAIIEV